MKKVCFVTNYKKTYFFDVIGKNLQDNGIEVYWIVLNKMLYDYLLPTYGASNFYSLIKNVVIFQARR